MCDDKNRLIQALKDAGCSSEVITEYLTCCCDMDIPKQEQLLKKQRCVLLEKTHACQKQIDCLDYLLQKQKKGRKL